ncbi:MAG: arginase [Fluviicola sp.]|nr:MAG: arginase [Fluviicola sp.]
MNSKTKLFHFVNFGTEDINHRYNKRDGERKLGDSVVPIDKAKFVILGIEESIGPKANKGRGGAENGFESFLSKFLNMQSNESLLGDDICILGKISSSFDDVPVEKRCDAVEELDQFVFDLLSDKLNNTKIPIIIGGGHNNAYPLMKYANSQFESKIDIVNLDAHADYRALEGRHSGNPFSYAFSDGFIDKYLVLGLHQRYNSQKIIDDLRGDGHTFTFFEDYIDGHRNLKADIDIFIKERRKQYLGIELDLDCIENMPSSAFSPSGISMETARYYIRKIAQDQKVVYLHLPEGAPLNESEKVIVGKTLAYLVTDFISSHGVLKL